MKKKLTKARSEVKTKSEVRGLTPSDPFMTPSHSHDPFTDSDDNVLDFYRDEFDRLVEFLDGGEYQVRAGWGMGPMSTFTWKVWTPESWKRPVSTKSARKT